MTHSNEDANTHPIPTIIEFILDETGSMASISNQTISGYNNFISEQKNDDLCLVTLTKFNTKTRMHTPYVDLDVNMIPTMNSSMFIPDGMTNLRNTIFDRINALSIRLKSWDVKPKVLFVCMTDGDDNASSVSIQETRKAIEHVIENNGWTCVYLGAHAGALSVAKELGFPEGNTKSFANVEIEENLEQLSKSTVAFRASNSTESSKTFFAQ